MLGIIIRIVQNAKGKLTRVQEEELPVYVPALIYSSQRQWLPSPQPRLLCRGRIPPLLPKPVTRVPQGFGQEFWLQEKHLSRFLCVLLDVFYLGC